MLLKKDKIIECQLDVDEILARLSNITSIYTKFNSKRIKFQGIVKKNEFEISPIPPCYSYHNQIRPLIKGFVVDNGNTLLREIYLTFKIPFAFKFFLILGLCVNVLFLLFVLLFHDLLPIPIIYILLIWLFALLIGSLNFIITFNCRASESIEVIKRLIMATE